MIVVADTSVILNLCCVRQAELLPQLFREVVIPPEVASEFGRLTAEVPRFVGLLLPAWIRQQPCVSIPQNLREQDLDAGETAALALALEIRADAVLYPALGPCWLLYVETHSSGFLKKFRLKSCAWPANRLTYQIRRG